MELLLWRWSTGAQIVSALILAVFFLVLGAWVRRGELRPWTWAWVANLAALAATVVFWYAQPTGWGFHLNIFGYVLFKTLFVVLLADGAAGFAEWRLIRWGRTQAIAVLVYAAITSLLVGNIDQLGVTQSGMIMLLFGFSGVLLLARGRNVGAARWLAAGFLLRAALAASETWAHWTQLADTRFSDARTVRFFMASYSSFDTAAEWVIGLGCVLMLYSRIETELKETNDDLQTAQEVLRQMADRDPMTGLSNRRALPGIFAEVHATGATLLFFDLNDFKMINDRWGHHAGDECLRRFAGALQACFRPDDRIVRYAGDEFLVVAIGLPQHRHAEIFEAMRANLARRGRVEDQESLPTVRFSVGVAELAPGGDPDAAIKAADEAMYQDKAGRKTDALSR